MLPLGCSGDKSLGSGLPLVDAAIVPDKVDTGLALDIDEGTRVAVDAATPDADESCRGKACRDYVGIDAGGGLTTGLVAWYRCESAAGMSTSSLPDSTTYGNDGTLLTGIGVDPGYSYTSGKVGNALALSATRQGYVAMPAGLLADACEVTIATWAYINTNNTWMRIWDFGQDTQKYMFLTPITNMDGLARFGISICGNTKEEGIKAQMAMPAQGWTHVALVLGASGATLYFNGVPVGTNASMTLRPPDLGRTLNNFIGRSQFSDDPYLDGNIDEFRIYSRALSPEEVRALANGA
jgi:hypothetical protein